MAIIGVEGVEIRIYKAEELILTLTTDPEGRANTMLEADTYRVEYWFEERKIGKHDITLEVDSHVVWSFPAILMAVLLEAAPKLEPPVAKLGDVFPSVSILEEVEAVILPEFYPSVDASIVEGDAKLGDVFLEAAISTTVSATSP